MGFKSLCLIMSLLIFQFYIDSQPQSNFDGIKERISANIQLVGKTLHIAQLPSDINQRNLLINDMQKKLKDNLGIVILNNLSEKSEKANVIETILHDSLQVLFCSICDLSTPDVAKKVDFKNRIDWLKNALVIFSADISNFNNKINSMEPRVNSQEMRDLSLDYLRAFSIQALFMRQFIEQAANNTICSR